MSDRTISEAAEPPVSTSPLANAYLRPSKYLLFEQVANPGRKTAVWNVRSVSHGGHLGAIRWHGPWRQYCFWPKGSTIFNADCLDTIMDRLSTCNRMQHNIRENTRAALTQTALPSPESSPDVE